MVYGNIIRKILLRTTAADSHPRLHWFDGVCTHNCGW